MNCEIGKRYTEDKYKDIEQGKRDTAPGKMKSECEE
jgi:hypothetical protein